MLPVLLALVTLTPSHPTIADALYAQIEVRGGCSVSHANTYAPGVVGTTVTYSDCPAQPAPAVFRTVRLGHLPAGAWVYEVFEADAGSPARLVSQQPFVVAPLLPLIFTPAVPTSADVIRTTIEVPSGCSVNHQTTVQGNVVRTTVSIRGCIVGPPPYPEYEQVELGPLAAGVYTYEMYETYNDGPPYFIWQQPLVVNAVAVPAASTVALLAMAIGLAIAALIRTA